ncbi:MAG: glycosyltransferase family 92 protein [Chloroflexi bacterium]|nr:glycosyltransferase family 92 protein [Chloroflexota bacterium]
MDYLSLCLICKDENDYLPEWLDYHILMGVERFYIYDNESKVSLRVSLCDYIERGWVVVVDIPGNAMQLSAYDHCLQTFGDQTFWLGFIDTDEFLVPKTTLDLKEVLKAYEAHGGLAVSSLFFGSNGFKARPAIGQIAAYTRRTHATFKENQLVKSIVQPRLVLMPNTPHDCVYKETSWCVNEGFLRVDAQRFPNHAEKIQLNHYYCRSEREIDLKMLRGRGDSGSAWPRGRFEVINSMSTYSDTCIFQNLEAFFQKEGLDSLGQLGVSRADSLREKMSILAHALRPEPIGIIPPREVCSSRAEFSYCEELKNQTRSALDRKEFDEVKRLTFLRLQLEPQNILLYIALSEILLDLGDNPAAWKLLSRAWEIAPNSYSSLFGMAFYFLRVRNFEMAEKTCHLLLGMAPHDLTILGFMTEAMIGQGRFDEALKIGIPVVELSAMVGELPDKLGVILVKQMADYLLEKKDFAGAVRLWQAGVKCQPGEVSPLLELARTMLCKGNKAGARQTLAQARELAPQSEEVLALIAQAGDSQSEKRKHR